MRRPELRSRFRRDLKRAEKGLYSRLLWKGGELDRIVHMLASDTPLPEKYRDHALHGGLEGKRECHIRPDLLLMYRYEGDDVLVLERLGSHAELFGM